MRELNDMKFHMTESTRHIKERRINMATSKQQLMESQKGNDVKDLMKKMDETETDLVNKRVNSELQKRQQAIVTRLLESEKPCASKKKTTSAKPKPPRPFSARHRPHLNNT